MQRVVAGALADALDKFFVVDKDLVETKLLRNAGISLRGTLLREQRTRINSTTCVIINGSVNHVTFRWSWGKDNKRKKTADFVKDASLVISGVSFLGELVKDSTDDDDYDDEASIGRAQKSSRRDKKEDKKADKSPKSTSSKKSGGLQAYVQEQVTLILDALTLSVSKYEFKIQLPNRNILRIAGESVDLVSFGRADGAGLAQELSMKALSIHLLTSQNDTYPILEPITYKATVKRKVGRRFSSWMRGLELVGESNDQGVVVHAGLPQITFLNRMGEILVESRNSSKDSSSKKEKIENRKLNSKEESPGVRRKTNDQQPVSTFLLHLSGVTLVFPTGAKASLSGLVARYHADGSVLKLEGQAGFHVDEFPVLMLGETSSWHVDVVNRTFSIQDVAQQESHDEVVAFIHVRNKEVKSVLKGIDEVQKIVNKTMEESDSKLLTALSSAKDPPVPEKPTKPWTAELSDGGLGFLWEGDAGGEAVEMLVRDIALQTVPRMRLKLGSVDKILMPGRFQLQTPMTGTIVTYTGKMVDISIRKMHGERLEPVQQTESEELLTDASGSSTTQNPFILPLDVLVTVDELQLDRMHQENQLLLQIQQLATTMKPAYHLEKRPEIFLSIAARDVDHNMFQLEEPHLSGILRFDQLDQIEEFFFTAKSVTVVAGYSPLEWTSVFTNMHIRKLRKKRMLKQRLSARTSQNRSHSQAPIRLPYATVEELKVRVQVDGVVGAKNVVFIPAFHGKKGTTEIHLKDYYTQRVLTKVPKLITHADVLGVNMQDVAVTRAGGLVGKAAMHGMGGAGGIIGGVVSVAAFDGVRNTLAAGKMSRGVEEDDKWQFGDLARGLVYKADEATKKGASVMGKDEEEGHDLVDWAVGATGDVVKYTDQEKARLGGAAAGTVGFGVGMVVGGPVGGVVGAVLVSAVTGTTIDFVDRKVKEGIANSAEERTRSEEPCTIGEENAVEQIYLRQLTTQEQDEGTEEGIELSVYDYPPPMAGPLLKRRDFVTWDWRLHYFVADRFELKYFDITNKPPKGASKRPDAIYIKDENGPKKTLSLSGLSIRVEERISNEKEGNYAFGIYSATRKDPLWVLSATTKADRSEWVERLQRAAESA